MMDFITQLAEQALTEQASDDKKMRQRIANLEATLEKVLKTARGDGREATSHEWQMIMRTAQAILEDKL